MLRGWEKRGNPSRFCSKRCNAIWQITHPKQGPTGIEKKMAVFLDMLGVTYEAQKPFPGIGVIDFYLPEQHIAVEVDGTFWHERERAQRSDAKKDRSLRARGIDVIRVPGVEMDPREGRTQKQREMFTKLAGGR